MPDQRTPNAVSLIPTLLPEGEGLFTPCLLEFLLLVGNAGCIKKQRTHQQVR